MSLLTGILLVLTAFTVGALLARWDTNHAYDWNGRFNNWLCALGFHDTASLKTYLTERCAWCGKPCHLDKEKKNG